ncbi:MAG: enoyl-CoA hydratase/isomerase family protein [Bacteroidales bacterium]|jgi:enoyl-CoA hydratase/carnithine racemase|nr:enoyl-CoA hydratase/isomerase family protein [Bacteroidales bacterium]
MKQSKIVSWERLEDIGILSISNDKKNYLDQPDFIDLEELRKWTYEKDLKGIIIRGIGRNFSAGANIENLRELANDQNVLYDKMNIGKKILDFIEDLNIPVIAAINGACFGGGLEIALACHMRIASENALFAFPEANHGLIPGLGGTYRLTQLLGKKSFHIILNADLINTNEALKIGLVDYISETKDAIDLAKEKLESMISDRSVEVIQSAMQAINNVNKLTKDEALKAETELFCKLAVNVKHHRED